jgi:1,4-dihydroxy-2-naphthoyl-CoA hydrolase
MFVHHARIYLHHTDAAGRLFFANQFCLVHEAKEHFFETIGFTMQELLEHPQVSFPLVHASSDFKARLDTCDQIDISVGIVKIGETSVVFESVITKGGVLAGTATTVNVAVDRVTGKKVPLPQDWRKRFAKALGPSLIKRS